MKRVKLILLASCLLPALAGAQEGGNASFLDLTPDAQSAGMGGTGLATTDNGSIAIFHNASTIAFSEEVMGGTYSYADMDKGGAIHSASLFYRIGREGKHGFTIGYRHFKQADYPLEDGGLYRPRAWALEAGYFRTIAQNLSMSLTLRYLQGKTMEEASNKNTFCVDLGASYHRNMAILDEYASWTIGFQAANLGPKLDGQKLPARLGLGGSVDLPFSMDHELQVALDLHYLLPSEYRHLQAGIGAEYNFLKYGVARAGYHFGDKDKGVGNYGTVGCGVRLWPIPVRADFSYALASKTSFMRNAWQVSVAVVL